MEMTDKPRRSYWQRMALPVLYSTKAGPRLYRRQRITFAGIDSVRSLSISTGRRIPPMTGAYDHAETGTEAESEPNRSHETVDSHLS